MVLALKSGIDSEITWALERLCRLCDKELFILKALPGLTEALVEWPSWYVKGGYMQHAGPSSLFATSKDMLMWTRHALECMFILRNASCNPANAMENAMELAGRRSTQELILLALHRLKPDNDTNVQFLLDIVDLLQSISTTSVLPPPDSHLFANPVPPLLDLAGTSTDRALILSSMETLHLLFSNLPNVVHLTPTSPALSAAIRYLPLINDKPLVAASLNYLYTHLSHPPMTKAFLMNPELKATLRLLVLAMLAEQEDEIVSLEVPGKTFTVPASEDTAGQLHQLSQEEFERLLPVAEPQRCYDW
jgi:chromatin structure-remodeling complex subunit RSC9